jgi:lia operon protein LiaF
MKVNVGVGLLVLVVGVAVLLGEIGQGPYYSIWEAFETFWPVGLIGWGLAGVVRWFRTRRDLFWALLMLVLGIGFLAERLAWIQVSIWGLLVPVALVVAGLMILFGKSVRPEQIVTTIDWDGHEEEWKAIGQELGESAKELKGFGKEWKERKRRWKRDAGRRPMEGRRLIKSVVGQLRIGGSQRVLEDTTVTLKAGDIHVDLVDAAIPEGETVLDIECLAGDLDVRLPEGLAVSVEAAVLFGQLRLFDEWTNNGMLAYRSPDYDAAERKVKLFLHVKFGDIDVRQVG